MPFWTTALWGTDPVFLVVVALERAAGIAFATGGSEVGTSAADAHSFATKGILLVCLVIR